MSKHKVIKLIDGKDVTVSDLASWTNACARFRNQRYDYKRNEVSKLKQIEEEQDKNKEIAEKEAQATK